MGQMIRCGALAVMLMAPVATGRAADCWLLGGQELAQAHRQGACRDAFARDTWDSAALPRPLPSPPQDPVRVFMEGIGQDVRAFVSDLDRDWRSITRSISPDSISPDTPPHTTPGR